VGVIVVNREGVKAAMIVEKLKSNGWGGESAVRQDFSNEASVKTVMNIKENIKKFMQKMR
jgi:hypothetical protein